MLLTLIVSEVLSWKTKNNLTLIAMLKRNDDSLILLEIQLIQLMISVLVQLMISMVSQLMISMVSQLMISMVIQLMILLVILIMTNLPAKVPGRAAQLIPTGPGTILGEKTMAMNKETKKQG